MDIEIDDTVQPRITLGDIKDYLTDKKCKEETITVELTVAEAFEYQINIKFKGIGDKKEFYSYMTDFLHNFMDEAMSSGFKFGNNIVSVESFVNETKS